MGMPLLLLAPFLYLRQHFGKWLPESQLSRGSGVEVLLYSKPCECAWLHVFSSKNHQCCCPFAPFLFLASSFTIPWCSALCFYKVVKVVKSAAFMSFQSLISLSWQILLREIVSVLKNGKSYGHDNFSPFLSKAHANSISSPLKTFINKSNT